MKLITGFKIDISNLSSLATTRRFKVTGDIGAVFSLQVRASDGRYYNFETRAFTAVMVETSSNRLSNIELTAGSYAGSILFPVDADGETYTVYLWAEPHFETELSTSISPENPVLYTTDITQVANATVGFLPKAATSGNFTDATNEQTIASSNSPLRTDPVSIDIDWTIENESSDLEGFGLKQDKTTVVDGDWYFTTTDTVDGTVTSSTTVVVDSLDDLVVGMIITGVSSGSLSGLPVITEIDIASKQLTLSIAQGFGDGITLTFKGYGSDIIGKVGGFEFSFSDLKVVQTPTTTTVRTAPSASQTVYVNGTYGISAGTFIKGFGVDNSTASNPLTGVSASSAAGSITTTVAQTLAVGTTLTISGSALIYTITGKMKITKFPASTITGYLDLDKLFTIGTGS